MALDALQKRLEEIALARIPGTKSQVADIVPGARTVSDLLTARETYKKLLGEAGGDTREAYNLSELARAGQPTPSMAGLPQEQMAAVNRIADTRDQPANAPLLAGYEALKGVEQNTGVPTISALADAGVPRVSKFKAGVTTDASILNLLSSILGPALGR